MHFIQRTVFYILGFVCITSCFAFNFKDGQVPIQLGFFDAKEGIPQVIHIQGLIGNRYTTTQSSGQSGLVGVGYFLPVSDKKILGLSELTYGVNAFYLGKTTVKGLIVQEEMFSNLSYQYDASNIPIYAALTGKKFNNTGNLGLVLHGGIGPNLAMLRNYQETSLDGGITRLNRSFYSNTATTFTAMGGIGVAINHLIPNVNTPLECAYRFFYLGQGALNKRTEQILNSLQTSNAYAQALVCSVTV
ncbi:MAG: hypothetical protein K0U37_02325 [Gammaproteobacteria bacterium]|nr:hypothetical protein [Gammaproteobacteria bacterium]